ncbi:unnamed protein product [Blepharisma stoltei]|uniref:Uncharacterized protein n=1 Tax=Blepharisma stoltei TaxID=1481888 RepID=A0AAU9J8Q3_9CILI|nr:unnamed protein product [Blepharisma stoltei]
MEEVNPLSTQYLSQAQPDIKKFIKHMHKKIDEIQSQMHESKQNYEQLRSEAKAMESQNLRDSNDITDRILDELDRIEQEFKKQVGESKTEAGFLKQQLASVTQEKMKLEQNSLLLATRVGEAEKVIGIELMLPHIDDHRGYE